MVTTTKPSLNHAPYTNQNATEVQSMMVKKDKTYMVPVYIGQRIYKIFLTGVGMVVVGRGNG